jgi:hypothetical protein
VKASIIGPCPKCLEMRPFIGNDQEIKKGEKVFLDCRICGASVEIFIGPKAMTLAENHDKQRKLFD